MIVSKLKWGGSGIFGSSVAVQTQSKCPLLTAFSFLLLSLSPLITFLPEGFIWGFEILHGLLTHKNIRIPIKKYGHPPFPLQYANFGRTRGDVWKQLYRHAG